ncbi:MAG: HRDC domain-containing protein [Verrucomicrobiaceae bacterium]|nr:HRDC domain-containing protein [Verrucomicrobiaceae bacterium]
MATAGHGRDAGHNHTSLPEGVCYVDSDAQLSALVERIKAVQATTGSFRCCLDTEADSLHHYQEKLCLIQLAFGDELVLIDPLAVPDVAPLIEVLDAGEVWFHGADYDLTLLRRTYGWTPQVVRDTQIAARLVGSRQFGLAALIENYFGKTLSKASQKADWSKRPLPSVMLHYAVDDVRYLLKLADILQSALDDKKRRPWFVESCASLRATVAGRSTQPKEDPWRVQGSGKLHRKGLAFLRDLWHWRDTIARERDVPCFRIISNKQLIDSAIALEAGEQVNPPAGWRPKWKKDFEAILQSIRDGVNLHAWPERLRPKGTRLSDLARDHLEKLCLARESVAKGLDIEPSLVGARGTLEQVVGSPEGISELLEWQQSLFGQALVQARRELGFEGSQESAVQ